MAGYTKLFASILHSTIWREPAHVRLVWITMLAMSDRDGVVEASVPGLADMARVSIEECQDALSSLSSPDDHSRSKDHEGRRITEIRGGWTILNYGYYRDKQSAEAAREKNAERVQRYRERKALQPLHVTPRTKCNPIAEADPYAEADPDPDPESDLSGARGVQGGESPDKPAQPTTKAKKPRKKAAHPLPADWRPNAQHAAYCRDHHLELSEQAEAFRDRNAARGELYADWDAAFRTWLRNAVKFADQDAAKSRERIAAHEARKHSTPDLDRVLEAGPDGIPLTLPQNRREGNWVPDRPPSQPRRLIEPPEPEQSPIERAAQIAATRSAAANAMAAIRNVGRIMPPATGTDGEL